MVVGACGGGAKEAGAAVGLLAAGVGRGGVVGGAPLADRNGGVDSRWGSWLAGGRVGESGRAGGGRCTEGGAGAWRGWRAGSWVGCAGGLW